MFIGFIAIIIVLLIIVAAMSTGSTSENKGTYQVEATKTATMISDLKNESKFYFAKYNNQDISAPGFTGESIMEYLVNTDFHKNKMRNQNSAETMLKSDWLGLTNDYTGPYLIASGPAEDKIRFISVPISSNSVAIQMIGVDKVDNKTGNATPDGIVDGIDETYKEVLEAKMNKFFPNSFVGF